jgi:RimJ/RimL family protein N-acetyltransferase
MRLESLRLYPAFFGTTYEEAAATPRLPFEISIAAQDPESVMFGAFEGERLCGICGLQREQRRRTRHRGELGHMYVSPRVTRQGVGGRLVAAVLDYALSDPVVRQVVLSVVADNRAAVRVYARAGFREYGRLENYFRYDDASTTQLFMVYDRDS